MFLPEKRTKLDALEQKRDSTRDPATRSALEAEITELKKSIKVMLDGLDEAADKATEARNRLIALFSDHEDNNCR